jgi:polar amino acid transport system substrate-binding protein
MRPANLRVGLAIGLVVIAGACGGTSSTQQPTVKTVTSGYLTVATYGTALPVIQVGPGPDQVGGTDGAWINAYASDHGLKVKLFQTTFESSILAVQQGKADMSVSFYYNPDRAHKVYYTYPIDIEGLQAFTKKSFSWNGASSLMGHKVGSVTGYEWIPYFQKAFGSSLLLYPTGTDAKTAFLNGQIDAYLDADVNYFGPPINASPDVLPHDLKGGDLGIPDSLIAVMSYNIVNCGEKDVANGMNDEMKKLQSSGKWATILTQTGAPAGTIATKAAPLETPTQYC